jgi:hypothetical protein
MFELETMTTVRVLDVRTLAAKNRKPDELPGMQLLVQATMPVASLAMFDPALPAMLARKAPADDQGRLEGIETLELTEIGQHMKRIPWVYDQTGCTVEFDRGLGGSSNLRLTDCTVHRVSFQPQEGVSAKVQWSIDAPALADAIRGKLTGMKATELPMTQHAPELSGQADLEDDAPKLTPAQLRKANAEGKTPEQVLEEAVQDGKATPETKLEPAWPFPKGDPRANVASGPTASSEPAPAPAPAAPTSRRGRAPTPMPSRIPPGVKYRDPETGQTWTGRGLKPRWLSAALENGKALADFAVGAAS